MASRTEYYDSLINKLREGQPLLDHEMRALAYAYREDDSKPSTSLTDLESELAGTGNSLAPQMIRSTDISDIDRSEMEDIAEAGGAEEGPGITAGGLETAGLVLGGRAVPSIISKLGTSSMGGAFLRSMIGKKTLKRGALAAGGVGLTAFGMQMGQQPGSAPVLQGQTPQGPQSPTAAPVDPSAGQNPQASVRGVIFGPNGEIQPLTDQDLGPEFGSAEALGSTPVGNFSPDLQGFADDLGIVNSTNFARAQLDPTFFGEVTLKEPESFSFPRVGSTTRNVTQASSPSASGVRGGVTPSQQAQLNQEGILSRENASNMGPNVGLPSRPQSGVTQEGIQLAREATAPGQVNIPSGSQINPKIAQEFQGRTLIEWAAVIAHKQGVPLNLLYGLINHESGWNPVIQGDNGQSHGLAQIYQPVWGDQVSVAESQNPVFALNWAARTMRETYARYGRWDVAVANHNSPVAAQHLAETGEFYNSKSKNYVSTIMNYANASGLDNWNFDVSDLTTSKDPGGGVPRPSFVSPDPASLRQFVRESFTSVFSRQPTAQEMEEATAKLNSLYRTQFDRNVSFDDGAGGEQVDPGTRFIEELEQSGEGQFMQERVAQRSFMDYAGEVARMLQGGL